MISTTVICAISVVALVGAEWRRNETARYLTKILASCAFVSTAFMATYAHSTTDSRVRMFQGAILIGQFLGLVGDVALLSKRGFLFGLVAFLGGHLAYVAAVGVILPPADWLGEIHVVALVPLGIGALVVVRLWSRLGSLAIPVIVYMLAISAMVIAALAAWRAGLVPTCFALGAALFFASDLAVARDKFVGPTLANKVWGLPAYYAAQLLIAWTL